MATKGCTPIPESFFKDFKTKLQSGVTKLKKQRVTQLLKRSQKREGGSEHACADEDCGDCVGLHPESNVDAEKEGLLDGQIGEEVEYDHVEHVPVAA